MDFEEAYRVADEAVFAHRAKRLTDAETTVLRGAWRTQSYEEIANHSQYSLNYLKRDVGPKLWRSLSEALGEEVGKTNFREALERRKLLGTSQDMLPGLPTGQSPSPPISSAKPVSSRLLSKDWGESFDISKSFYGRTEELAQLETWALTDQCRLVGIFGRGGMGKTSLAAKLADQIKDQFEFFIWRSLRYSPPPTEIFEEIIAFLSQHQEADIPTDPHAAIGLLLQYLRKRRCLIVLDSAEMVLQPDDRTGRYLSGFEAYGELFTRVGREPHQSCLVLTSREKLKEFTAYEGDALPIRSLQLQGLDQAAARAVLQDKGFPKLGDADRLLIQSYAGNPYDFKIAASAIKNLFSNRITDFLATNTLVFDSIRILLDKQFERLSSAEKEIIYWLAIYRETVTLTELRRAILLPPLRQTNLLEALYALGRRSLVENQPDGFTLQPTVLEYITQDLIEQIYQEITTEQINLLNSHALTQAKGNDYIRTLQIHTILRPLLDRLLIDFDNVTQLKNRLLHLLETWRNHCSIKPGYLGSNILSLLRLLCQDLDGEDFLQGVNCASLSLRQSYLQGILLQDVDFSSADLTDCVFTETLGVVWSIDFSADGEWLAIGDDNAQISIWDRLEDRKLMVLDQHDSWVRSVTFSPDRQWLASGSQDLTVRLWHVETGDYRLLVDPELQDTGLKSAISHKDWVRCVKFSPDGCLLASSSDDFTIKLWDRASGQLLNTLGCENRMRSIAFSSDGKTLASCSDDHTVTLWDIETGTPSQKLEQHTDWVRSVAFSPDGKLLASCSDDRTIKLWDIERGRCLKTLEGHEGWVRSVAFSKAGTILASGSDDQTVKLWQVATGTCLNTLAHHTGMVLAVAFSPDGKVVASGGDDQTVRQWDVATGRCLKTIQGYTNGVRSVAFSPDGKTLASGGNDNTVKLWSLATGEFRVLTRHSGRVWSVAFSPNGQFLASGGDDTMIQFWNLATGEVLSLAGHDNYVRSVVFSHDGTRLASSSYDKTIRLWDVETHHCLQVLDDNEHWVRTIALSPNGKQLASGNDSQIISLWDLESGDRHILGKHEHRVRSVAFSPDGNLLASGSDDHQIKLWNVETREELTTLNGHGGGVQSIVFVNQHTLVSGSDDSTVKVWDLTTASCVKTLARHDHWVRSVALSADGEYLATAGNDRLIQIWQISSGDCVKTLKLKSPYEGMNITRARGLSPLQKKTLLDLGAIDHNPLGG